MKDLIRLWRHILPKRKKTSLFLLALMFCTSFVEVVSISAVIPFLGVLASPEAVFNEPLVAPLISTFNFQEPNDLIVPMTILFCIAAIVAATMRLLLLYASTKLTFEIGKDFSVSIFDKTIHQTYSVHISRNSSEVINSIVVKLHAVIFNVVQPIILMIGNVMILSVVISLLLFINPLIAISAFLGFGVSYLAIFSLNKKRLNINSTNIASNSDYQVKILQESLGSIRDLLIDGNQDVYTETYKRIDSNLRNSQANNIIISGSPRYIMEAIGMVLIAVLSLLIVLNTGQISSAIPILGVLALGSQRLLPILQQLYSGWSGIKGSQVSLNDVLLFLDQEYPLNYEMKSNEDKGLYKKETSTSLPFKKKISLENLSFKYEEGNHLILQDITLVIEKGQRVGFVGETGSGKSTLLDIIMGLISPTEGSLKVDGEIIDSRNLRSWQDKISHVPQSVLLIDSSIEENIAFGIPRNEINQKLVQDAAKKAQISSVIENWELGYQTQVGERGVKLSGGQQQRVGIARALYKESEVIIFDEATSALDDKTEKEVMEAINRLDDKITILMIAHRISTLSSCDKIIEINEKSIKSERFFNK